MFGLGYQELLVILVIVLVLFGGSKLPELAKSLGTSVREFKKGIETAPVEDKTPEPVPDAPAAASAPLRLLQGASGRDLEPLPALRHRGCPGVAVHAVSFPHAVHVRNLRAAGKKDEASHRV